MQQSIGSLQPSDWIAICSVIVAACALGISIWQGILARQHARLSSRPLLVVRFNIEKTAGLSIRNSGLGPALLTGLWATYKNGKFSLLIGDEFYRLLEAMSPDKSRFIGSSIRLQVPNTNSAIAADEIIHLISVESDYEAVMDSFVTHFSRVALRMSFKDMYGNNFERFEASGINA